MLMYRIQNIDSVSWAKYSIIYFAWEETAEKPTDHQIMIQVLSLPTIRDGNPEVLTKILSCNQVSRLQLALLVRSQVFSTQRIYSLNQ